ncbi:MAG: hypothetical protein JJU20_04265 [Opitutales bacterium]|nr:hypothetical protein [Opitutales bacterium]
MDKSVKLVFSMTLLLFGCFHPGERSFGPEVDLLDEDKVEGVVSGYVAFEKLENSPAVVRQPSGSPHISAQVSTERAVENRFLILFDENGQVTEIHVLNAEDPHIAAELRERLYQLVLEPGYLEGQPVAFYLITRISSTFVRDVARPGSRPQL